MVQWVCLSVVCLSHCWCVDGLGHEVPDTRTAVYLDKHKPNCGVYDMRTGDMSWCSGSVCLSQCWCLDLDEFCQFTLTYLSQI